VDARQWEAALGVIQGMALVDDLEQLGPTALDEIYRLVPSDLASFNEIDPAAQRASVVGRPRPPTRSEMEPTRARRVA
jgi:hypothetical protein